MICLHSKYDISLLYFVFSKCVTVTYRADGGSERATLTDQRNLEPTSGCNLVAGVKLQADINTNTTTQQPPTSSQSTCTTQCPASRDQAKPNRTMVSYPALEAEKQAVYIQPTY